MKKWFITITLTAMLFDVAFATNTFNWFGVVSSRLRHEISEEYYGFTATDSARGLLKHTDANTKTRLGYKFGFTVELSEYVTGAVTLRSGVGSVMWQDVNNENTSGLQPGLQEAYINWKPPYADLMLGRVPQKGNAMWDLYAASNNLRDPVRQDNATDGVFNDKMGFLNGAKLTVPVGPVTIRGAYHTDYVSGYERDYTLDNKQTDISPQMDQYIFIGGFSLDVIQTLNGFNLLKVKGLNCNLDFDYGLPSRIGDKNRTSTVDTDSVYVDENIWGITEKIRYYLEEYQSGADFIFSYGYDRREDVYTARFWDYTLAGEYRGLRLTGRYQYNSQILNFRPYYGATAIRTAMHVYLNYILWNLNIQPRFILFETEIEGNKTSTNERYELTTTIRF
ncbi:MAG: hypothetical protein P9X24_02525 [Candidatus Hatepunaea meridiana]|nr:hypothetical protein [Candidatus Hatepunaea meridiana]